MPKQASPSGWSPSRTALMRSSAFRLTMTYTAVFGLSVLVVLAFIYVTTAQAISRQTDDTITAEIDALYQHYVTESLPGLVATIEERTQAQTLAGGLYLLSDGNGHKIAGNLNLWPNGSLSQDGWLTFHLNVLENDSVYGRGRVFMLPGGYRLLVGRDMQTLANFQTLMMETMTWAGVGTVVLGVLGGFAFSRRVVSRLETINESAEHIMDGDITHRVPLSGRGDEFDRLAVTLNAMLDQIEHLMAGIRTVTNNIAHDLRSPLTRMRSQLEHALLGSQDSEALRETCAQAIAEADSLLTTFNALLSIAEAEAGSRLAEASSVDLGALSADVVDLYDPVAEDAGLRLSFIPPSTVVNVLGNRELLFQATANLIDNAIKYTPAPGCIVLGCGQLDTGEVFLDVTDDGPGIPAEDHQRVLERFVRLDASRSTPGNGLGLSLVLAICRLHRTSLSLQPGLFRDVAHPGLKVRLLFPAV